MSSQQVHSDITHGTPMHDKKGGGILLDIPEEILFQVLDFVTSTEDEDHRHTSGNVDERVGVDLNLLRYLNRGLGGTSKRGKRLLTSYLEQHAIIDANFQQLSQQSCWFGALRWLARHKYHLRTLHIMLGDKSDVKLFYYLLRSCHTKHLTALHVNTKLYSNVPYFILDHQGLTVDDILKKDDDLNMPEIWTDIECGLQLTIHNEAPALTELTIPIRIDGTSTLKTHLPLFKKPTLRSITIDLCWDTTNTGLLSPQDFWFICDALKQTPNLTHLILRSQLDIPTPSQAYACTIQSDSLETLDISHLKRGFYLRNCVCPSIKLIIPPQRGSIRMPGHPWHEQNSFDILLNETLQDQFLNDLRHI